MTDQDITRVLLSTQADVDELRDELKTEREEIRTRLSKVEQDIGGVMEILLGLAGTLRQLTERVRHLEGTTSRIVRTSLVCYRMRDRSASDIYALHEGRSTPRANLTGCRMAWPTVATPGPFPMSSAMRRSSRRPCSYSASI